MALDIRHIGNKGWERHRRQPSLPIFDSPSPPNSVLNTSNVSARH